MNHRKHDCLLVIGLALLMTALNALKPPVIDDPVYLSYAREFAIHPDRPYAFDYYGKPANDILVPPVFPAWLACGMRLLGEEPAILKFWLFPIVLLFVASLLALLRRVTPGLERPLLILSAFSPAILPSVNLMLDIPVLAAGLASVALYLHAADRSSIRLAFAAGLLAGVAMETKYTAFILPALFLAHAWQLGHWRGAIAAAVTGVGFFVACEIWIACLQGESHFVLAMAARQRAHNAFRMPRLLAAAVSLLGGLGVMVTLVGVTALGATRRSTLLALGAMVVGFGLIVLVPDRCSTILRNGSTKLLTVSNLVFVPMGVMFFAVLHLVVRRLPLMSAGAGERRTDRFLTGWLVLEFLGYLGLSPFPAVRRVLGMLIVSTLIVGRLASRTCQRPESTQRVALLSAAGVMLGLAFYLVELRDAYAERDALNGAVQFVKEREPGAKIRFVGTWGSVYHAERADLEWSPNGGEDVRSGEWLIHDPRDGMPLHPATAARLEWAGCIVIQDSLPICTQRTFYESRTPLIHFEEPLARVDVYRAR